MVWCCGAHSMCASEGDRDARDQPPLRSAGWKKPHRKSRSLNFDNLLPLISRLVARIVSLQERIWLSRSRRAAQTHEPLAPRHERLRHGLPLSPTTAAKRRGSRMSAFHSKAPGEDQLTDHSSICLGSQTIFGNQIPLDGNAFRGVIDTVVLTNNLYKRHYTASSATCSEMFLTGESASAHPNLTATHLKTGGKLSRALPVDNQ